MRGNRILGCQMLAGGKHRSSLRTIEDVQQLSDEALIEICLSLGILATPSASHVSVCLFLAQALLSYQHPSPTLLEPTSLARLHTKWGGRKGNYFYLLLSLSPGGFVISVSAPLNEFSAFWVFLRLALLKPWRYRESICLWPECYILLRLLLMPVTRTVFTITQVGTSPVQFTNFSTTETARQAMFMYNGFFKCKNLTCYILFLVFLYLASNTFNPSWVFWLNYQWFVENKHMVYHEGRTHWEIRELFPTRLQLMSWILGVSSCCNTKRGLNSLFHNI